MTEMNRQEANSLIRERATADLKDEIEYQMECVEDDRQGSDGPYDETDALDDTLDRAEGNLLSHCREIAITLGWYREVSEKELANTICTGKKYDFKLKGKKYKWHGQ